MMSKEQDADMAVPPAGAGPNPMLLERLAGYLRQRSGALLCLLALVVLVVIPFRIHLYDFAAQDDARRHVAKVISGRDWSDIVVLDKPFTGFDHNQGWHVILGGVHRLGLDQDGLLKFSAIGLFLAFVLTGLWIYRREPDAWMVAMLAAALLTPCPRWMQGRPYILAAAIFLILLHLWREPRNKEGTRVAVTVALFALATWIHGSWYLFALMPLGLLCCGRFREAGLNAASWLGGSMLGACLTGRPLGFLIDHLIQAKAVMHSSPVTRLLVPEFQPSLQVMAPILVLPLLVWKHQHGDDLWKSHGRNPAFWLMIVGWILGFSNGRFWVDWGSVAFLTWVAWTLAPDLKALGESRPFRRIFLGGLLASGIYLSWSADADSRWSNNEYTDPLNLEDPAHEGCLPDPGGILYADDMLVFYLTFYQNPHGPWRYILGYEAALMPPEDLRILRQIQFYQSKADHLYQPWVDKFTPADRLVLLRDPGNPPQIKGLVWKYAAYKTWVGRLPRAEAAPRGSP